MKYLTSLFCLFTCGGAVIQEITFHESFQDGVGNSFTFRAHITDASRFSLDKVVRYCQTSQWIVYSDVNFLGSYSDRISPGCYYYEYNGTYIKSFRYLGNRDTSVDGVSLYPIPSFFGTEIYVGHSPYGGIDTLIQSLAFTGKSDWTLFEGINFQGRTACLTGGTGDKAVTHYYTITGLNIPTVGSLFKGQCLSSVTDEKREELRRQVLLQGPK